MTPNLAFKRNWNTDIMDPMNLNGFNFCNKSSFAHLPFYARSVYSPSEIHTVLSTYLYAVMGYMVDAHCPKCGYIHRGLRFGYGMMRMEPPDFPAPCLNTKSRRVTTKNLCAQHPEHFRFYTDPSMYNHQDNGHHIDFSDQYLSATGNYCPSCKEYAMKFEVVASVD